MSGQVPPSTRAKAPARLLSKKRSVNQAANLYERFTGHDAEIVDDIELPPIPSALAVIGMLDGVLYTTKRDGKIERYKHEFADDDRPLLAVSPNGRALYLIGGRYVFTERGIVDMSDEKNLPAKFRRR